MQNIFNQPTILYTYFDKHVAQLKIAFSLRKTDQQIISNIAVRKTHTGPLVII